MARTQTPSSNRDTGYRRRGNGAPPRQQQRRPANTTTPPVARIPVAYMPKPQPLNDRGKVLTMLELASAIYSDEPGAAIGLCGIVTCFDTPYRAFAATELVKFLQMTQWSRPIQVLANAFTDQEAEVKAEATVTGRTTNGEPYDTEPYLKLQLRKQAGKVIGYFHGRVSPRSLLDTAHETQRIAAQLEVISSRAQGSAHIVAAACYMLGGATDRRSISDPDPRVWSELQRGVELAAQVHGGNGEWRQVVAEVAQSGGGTQVTAGATTFGRSESSST